MLYLSLLRHAKPDSPIGLTDHEKPLSELGKKHVQALVAKLDEDVIHPSTVLVSSAKRASQTVDTLLASLHNHQTQVTVLDDLYNAPADILYMIIHRHGGSTPHLMLCGHNPGMEQLASRLTDQDMGFGTCDYVRITFDVDSWSNIVWGLGKLEQRISKSESN